MNGLLGSGFARPLDITREIVIPRKLIDTISMREDLRAQHITNPPISSVLVDIMARTKPHRDRPVYFTMCSVCNLEGVTNGDLLDTVSALFASEERYSDPEVPMHCTRASAAFRVWDAVGWDKESEMKWYE